MKSTKKLSYSILIILLVILPFYLKAQKLPNVQKQSKVAPTNIKVDGKLTEWNNLFEAHNIVSRVFYTVSNDDKNLYLTLQAEDEFANEKALFGICFTIKSPSEIGSKKSKDIAVTFPTNNAHLETRRPLRLNIWQMQKYAKESDSLVTQKRDSIRLIFNNLFKEVFKDIDVIGIKGSELSTISIYNPEGLKVAAEMNEEKRYTYELAIPLKYLGASINNGQNFTYNIRVNGLPTKSPGSPYGVPVITSNVGKSKAELDNAFINNSTDFSGFYKLIK